MADTNVTAKLQNAEKKAAENNTFLPWVEKYRPDELSGVISHQHVIDTISRYLESGQLPHLLFHGPPGTGKTSTILAIAKHMYGSFRNAFALELNASDDRGINTVREQIKVFAETRTCVGPSAQQLNANDENENKDINKGGEDICMEGEENETDKEKKGKEANNFFFEQIRKNKNFIKLIILDEADQMTSAAQNALRRIMEKYARNVRFCFVCNYVNKIAPAIQSRCSRFRFSPLKAEAVWKRTMEIAKSENILLKESGMKALQSIAKGDMRKILNTLQSVSMGNAFKPIDDRLVFITLGMPTNEEVSDIFKTLMEASFTDAFAKLESLQNSKGYSVQDFVNGLYEHVLTVVWPNSVIIQLLIRLADLEERLSVGARERVQLLALVGSFIEARFELENLKFKIAV